jgi:transcriptional regulator with XRE-family HTH domain
MMAKKAPNPTDKHVGSRVRMRRMMLSMSQEKLGDALGLTFQQVQKYEKGVNRVGAGRLTKIAEVLGIDVGAFFTGKDVLEGEQPKDGGSSPLKLLTVSGAFRLLRAYGDIEDSNLRRAIVDLVEQISSQKRMTA